MKILSNPAIDGRKNQSRNARKRPRNLGPFFNP
jgi:hypothetical protein